MVQYNRQQTYLPRAKRRGDRDIQLPEVVLQQLEHPGGPAVSLGDERDVLEILRAYTWYSEYVRSIRVFLYICRPSRVAEGKKSQFHKKSG